MHFTLGTHPWAKNYNKTQGKSGISMRKLREPAFPGKRRWFGPPDRPFLSYEYYTCLESRWANIQEIRPPSILWISCRTHQAVHLSKNTQHPSGNQPSSQTPKRFLRTHLLWFAIIKNRKIIQPSRTDLCLHATLCAYKPPWSSGTHAQARNRHPRHFFVQPCLHERRKSRMCQKCLQKHLGEFFLFLIDKHRYSTHTHHKTYYGL